MKKIFILIAIFLFTNTFAFAAPCSPNEEAIHKRLFPNSECWKPDVHKLPYGISYPKYKKLSYKYAYLINLTNRNLIAGVIEFPAEGDISGGPDEDESFEAFATLIKGSYTWVDVTVIPSSIFTFIADELGGEYSIRDFSDEKIVKGPTKYIFLTIEEKNHSLIIKKISEKAAIEKMRYLRFVSQYPNY